MTDFQIVVWTLLPAEAVLLAVFVWLPVMGGERAFFGVRVEARTLSGEGRRTPRRYWLTLVAGFVLICALGFYASARFAQPAPAVAACNASTAAAFLIYGPYARVVRPLNPHFCPARVYLPAGSHLPAVYRGRRDDSAG